MWDKEDNMATINSDAILEGFYNSKNATPTSWSAPRFSGADFFKVREENTDAFC